MKDTKRFIVLGLGSFGAALARKLASNGCRVTGADQSEELVEAIKDELYEAVVADVTDREALEALVVQTADSVFISLGENIEPSLLCALHLKELGAKRVVVKGVTKEHGKILERLGVERVVFPEAEIAVQLADAETWPNVLDALTIDTEHSITEIAVPNSLVGLTMMQAELRRRFGLTVLGIKDHLNGNLTLNPPGEFKLTDDQLLLAIGKKADLERFRELK